MPGLWMLVRIAREATGVLPDDGGWSKACSGNGAEMAMVIVMLV